MRTRFRAVWILCGVALLGWWGLSRLASKNATSEATAAFHREAVVVMPPFPPVTNIPAMSASEAAGLVNPEELVLSVSVNGEQRAYPLNMIDAPERKVIDDVLGGEPIVVTWCDMCHTGAVFSRKVGDLVLDFGCSGMLWRGSLVIYDEQTKSFWNQMLQKSVAGPLEGTRLTPLPAGVTTFKRWSAEYENGSVLVTDRVSEALVSEYYSKKLNLADFVLGINLEHPEAWRYDLLAETPLIETEWNHQPIAIVFDTESNSGRIYSRQVHGAEVTLRLTPDGMLENPATGERWNPLSGRSDRGEDSFLTPIATTTSFEKSWRSYFPKSNIHVPPSAKSE